ncbi:hypothetical protein HAX54_016423 [Datura stramonium]|uniref:Uncharacterized protein n=1 Tax=Datura stramonium TaxID=4076 RepID=A0ABS8UKC6_DATST|nr:hypothetical protein [Datura stramonium]
MWEAFKNESAYLEKTVTSDPEMSRVWTCFDSSELKRVHTEANAGLSWVESNRVEPEIEEKLNSSESNPAGRVSSPEFDETDADVDVDSPVAKQIRDKDIF